MAEQGLTEDDFELDDEYDCTRCDGEGACQDDVDPIGLDDCEPVPHPCHACGGSGRRSDQVVFY